MESIKNAALENANAALENANAILANASNERTALMERLNALKQAERAAREEKKELRAALKQAERAERRPSELDTLAAVICDICANDKGATKAQILAAYLAALGITDDDALALKKSATLNAQLGRRILPRLERLGYSLRSERAMNEKACRYIAERLPESENA